MIKKKITLESVLAEIRKNLSEAKMKKIEELTQAGIDRDERSMQAAAAGRPQSSETENKPTNEPAPSSMQADRPSIRSGLNKAGLRTQGGVVGGATPADRAREANAAPTDSSLSPVNVAKQAAQEARARAALAAQNRTAADDRDTAEVAAQAANREPPKSTPAPAPAAKQTFGQAFKAARERGDTTFSYGDKSFNTAMKGETRAKTQAALSSNRMKSGNVPTPPRRPTGM